MKAVAALVTVVTLAACSQPGGVSDAESGGAVAAPDIVSQINAARAARDVPALTVDPALTQAAVRHAGDMAAKGYQGHTAPDGSTPLRRMRAAGFDACFAAEAIAKGPRDARAVVEGWALEARPARVMFSTDPRHVGAGRAPGDIWVMTLARAC